MNGLVVISKRRPRVEVIAATPNESNEKLREMFIAGGLARSADNLSRPGSGMKLTLTRQGVEIHAWYDHYVGIEGGSMTWAEFDAMRAQL